MPLQLINHTFFINPIKSNPNKTLFPQFPQIQSNTTMSRSLSLTLTRISTTTSTAARRNHSTQPEIGVAKTKEEIERAALKKLEDAIHRLIVKKSQPDWLPFVPGGSYWVPPKSKSRGFAQVVVDLVRDSTSAKEFMKNDVAFGLHSNRGWPSSAQFFKGPSDSPLEEETNSEDSNQSEEDEG